MADQLTSVRLTEELLDNLRLIADAHGNSVAAEVRVGLEQYVNRVKSSPELQRQLKKNLDEREKLITRLLVSTNSE